MNKTSQDIENSSRSAKLYDCFAIYGNYTVEFEYLKRVQFDCLSGKYLITDEIKYNF